MTTREPRHNINMGASCPMVTGAPKFYVTATETIVAPQRNILPGEHLLVDPNFEPYAGKMVVVDGRCEPWAHQRAIAGVVVGLCSDVQL